MALLHRATSNPAIRRPRVRSVSACLAALALVVAASTARPPIAGHPAMIPASGAAIHAADGGNGNPSGGPCWGCS